MVFRSNLGNLNPDCASGLTGAQSFLHFEEYVMLANKSVFPSSLPALVYTALFLALETIACSTETQYSCGYVGEEIQMSPIVGGFANSGYLKLDQRERNAVVRIDIEFDESPFHDVCSGVVISEKWILTVKHCLHNLKPLSIEVTVGDPTSGSGSASAGSGRAIIHDTLDVMLISMDSTIDNAGIDIAPVTVGSGTVPLNGLVEIAGYGTDEFNNHGARHFAVESIVSTDEMHIVVSGFGASGNCAGDSGGPLLTRGENGGIAVIGLLTSGSADCWGEDHYININTCRDWIFEKTGSLPLDRSANSCDTPDLTGRCYGDLVVWCDTENVRHAMRCSGGKECGWSQSEDGFRCVDLYRDPCEGVDDVGLCNEGEALRCIEGSLERSPCYICDADCMRFPDTGVVSCAY